MEKEKKLTAYCMLPLAKITVTPEPNPTYWQWCDLEGKRPEGVAQNKRGVWKHFVDVKHGDGPVQTFDTEPHAIAWEALEKTAIREGYKEGCEIYADKCKFHLDGDGDLDISCKQRIDDENNVFWPELTIEYEGGEGNMGFKMTVEMENADLLQLGRMLLEIGKRIKEANK
jgi:hypothetical protein